jgi:hypothetical protein
MQPFGPRTSTMGTVYTAAQVQAALTAPVLQERWVWDRLDQTGRRLDDLTPFVEMGQNPPIITHDTTQAVKRSLRLRLRGDAPIYKGGSLSLNIQVRAHHQIRMADGGYVDFPLGTFTVLPGGAEITPAQTFHDLIGYDYGQLLLDYNFQVSASVPAGVSGVNAVASLLAIPGGLTPLKMVIPDLGRTLVQPVSFDPAMSRLKAINDVLSAINYFPAWFDANGVMRSAPIPDWNTVRPIFTFDATRAGSILAVPLRQTVDWSAAGNQQTVYVEDPRRPFFSATYTNNNPLSPLSVQNYGHVKSLPPYKDSNIPDRATAYLIARALCQQAARIHQSWPMETATWPLSEDQDVSQVAFTETDDGAQRLNFVEMGWSMRCQPGAKTTSHTFQQLVPA